MANAKSIPYSTLHSCNGIDVITYVGDITTITDADAIVTGEGERFENESCITKALLQISPLEFAQKRHDLKTGTRKFKLWTVYTTELLPPTPFTFVFHVIMKNSSRKWTKNMKNMYRKLLEKADKCKVKTLLLPLLGTGRAKANGGDAVKAIILSIMKFRKPRYLKKIYLVTLNKDIADIFDCDCKHYFMKSHMPKVNCCFKTTDEDRTAYEKTSWILPEASVDIRTSELGHQKSQNSSKQHMMWRQRRWSSTNANTIDKERAAFEGTYVHTGSIHTYRSLTLDGNQRHSPIIYCKDSSRESYTSRRRTASQPRHNKGDYLQGRQRGSTTACIGDGYQGRKDTHSDTENKAVHMLDVSVISNCPICISPITDPKRLDKCGHVFCRGCIDDSFKHFKPVCPSCNMVYGVLTGNQPDGTMDVGFSGDHLPGYERHGTITITYYFPSGIQGKEHPNPGQQYKGTTRRAYLPDCQEGREILRLLKTAFDRKLTFTIGRSTTTGQDNVVTWNDIHHKTNMDGGPTRFGYPDPSYLARVKDELASKGVTEAQTNGRALAREDRIETHL